MVKEDEVEYEVDRLEVAWARTENSGSATSAFAVTTNGKIVALNVLTIGRTNVQTQTLPRLRLTQKGKSNRIRTGTPNTAKTL